MKQTTVARRKLFSTAHLYRQSKFSHAENLAHFGACFSEHGHGHNYVIVVELAGEIDQQTGLIMNLTDLDQWLTDVVSPLDHHHVNFDVPEFQDTVPTTENLALYCRTRLLRRLQTEKAPLQLVSLKLYETDDLWVEITE
jgi:6-pyruvoyltetrahydropterin/6-carboxytetrahydropterin synthase